MLFNHFISLFNALEDNEPFFIRFSSDLKKYLSKEGKAQGANIIKTTSLMAVKGVEYAKQKTVQAEVENGKVLTHELPWGEWNKTYKNIIDHKGGHYARMYFPDDKLAVKKVMATEVHYFLNGMEIAKDELIAKGLIQPSYFNRKGDGNCLTINIEGVEMIGA